MKKKIVYIEVIIMLSLFFLFMNIWNSRREINKTANSEPLPTQIHIEEETSPSIITIDLFSQTNLASEGVYQFVKEWGTKGSSDGQFNYPKNVVIDWKDNIYIVDYKNSRIQKFDSYGNFITKWVCSINEDEQLVFIYAIAADAEGNIYTSGSEGSDCIQKFTSDGNLIKKWKSNIPPSEIIIAPDEYMYLAMDDSLESDAIIKFDCINSFTKCFEIFKDITSETVNTIAINSSGEIFAVITCSPRYAPGYGSEGYNESIIQKYTSEGHIKEKWCFEKEVLVDKTITPYKETSAIVCSVPYITGIKIDPENNIFITDCNNHCIWKLSPEGKIVAKWGTEGSAEGQFSYPSDIEIDSEGNVYVVDSGNNRIQKFKVNIEQKEEN